MRPPETQRRPGQVAAAVITGNEISAEATPIPIHRQVVDADGCRLSVRRSPVVGAPKLARPSVWHLAADRWSEPRP